MSPKKDARKSAKRAAASARRAGGFTEEERAAMRERAQELKAARRGPGADPAEAERAVRAKISAMPEPDRAMAGRIHAIIRAAAPDLVPRLWYGMPAYARDGDVVCYFQPAHKFKARYATLGFSDEANLDDGALWPVVFALKRLTPAGQALIAALVIKAVS